MLAIVWKSEPVGMEINFDLHLIRWYPESWQNLLNISPGGWDISPGFGDGETSMEITPRTQLLYTELKEAIATLVSDDGDFSVSEDVRVFRRSAPTDLNHGESSVSYCAIAQGAKHVEFGDLRYTYGREDTLITSIEMPMVSRVVEASEEHPYLSMTLDLNPGMVRSVLTASSPENLRGDADLCAHKVKPMELGLLDATVRLMQSINRPEEAEFLTPMIKREIVYRLLMTDHAGRMMQIAGMSAVSNQIKAAIEHLRSEFSEPLRVADIASAAGMSTSSFHEHFKRVTGLTPLQYQKQLRLRHARHLLLSERVDAAEAGFTVGYSDASHFNRDYKRQFGLPPKRDIEQAREAAGLTHAD